jgi:hypothetical protein
MGERHPTQVISRRVADAEVLDRDAEALDA